MSSKRVVVIGMDGATFKLINEFKVFEELQYRNVMRSTVPPLSPIAWTSIFTGADLTKHGIYGFVLGQWGESKMPIMDSSYRRAPALWEVIPEGTYYNIPFAYPCNNKNVICGFGNPDTKDYADTTVEDFDACEKIFVEKGIEAMALFNKGFEKVFCAVFRITDVVQHFHWGEKRIERIYVYLQKFLEFILANKRPDDVVMIVSDHGFTKLKGVFHMVNFLLDNNWLVCEGMKQERSLVRYNLMRTAQKMGIVDWMKQNKHLPWVKWLIGKAMLEGERYTYLKKIDWGKTLLAYAEASEGVVLTGSKGYPFDEVRKKALESGAIQEIHKLGNYLLFEPKEGYCVDGYQPGRSLVSMPDGIKWTGTHDMDGVFMCSHDYKAPDVTKVLPAVLKVLGVK